MGLMEYWVFFVKVDVSFCLSAVLLLSVNIDCAWNQKAGIFLTQQS